MPCTATTQAGVPCRAFAPEGRSTCRVHDPEYAAAVQAARLRGAEMAGKLRSLEGKRRKLDNPRALAAFMSSLIHDLVEQKVEAELVKTVAYSISVQCKVLDLARGSDLEQLRDELRDELAELRRRRGGA